MLWYCLRSIDINGRGELLPDDALEVLQRHYGYRRQTAYKHLEAGDGVYWRIHHSTQTGKTYIILNSLFKVAAHLGVRLAEGAHFIEVEASGLPPSRQVQGRRALLYNTGAYRPFAIQRNDPISRRSLEDKTGVQERQQRRYDSKQEARGFPIR
jgi:hypothetical protein